MSATGNRAARDGLAGALQIVRLNWPTYAAALAVSAMAAGCLALAPLPPVARIAAIAVAALPLVGVAASVAVSHYVYDRSDLQRWAWLRDCFDSPPERWANVHAGLDQTTASLREIFPGPGASTWDVYRRDWMTEPAIDRARSRADGGGATRADPGSLPADDATLDAVFVIFAAHEIRSAPARGGFFRELHRILRPRGRAVVVEHLRDAANLLAYGPGALHFYPRREWIRLAGEAGLELALERSVTPFVRCFVLEKP